MRIFFDTDELATLRDRAGHAGFDVAGIGAELAAAAGAVAVHELVSFRIGNAVRLAADVGAVSGDLGRVAAHLEGDGAIAQGQIARVWWSQGAGDVFRDVGSGRRWWTRTGIGHTLKEGFELGHGLWRVGEQAHWIARAIALGPMGFFKGATSTWKFGGYYDRHLTNAFGAASDLLGLALRHGHYDHLGKVVELGGRFADSSNTFVRIAKAGKLFDLTARSPVPFAKLGAIGVAFGAYSLIGGEDRKAYVQGMASKNSADRTRAGVTYVAQAVSVGGQALMLVPCPPLQAAGAVIVGVSTAVEGVAWLTSSANRQAVVHDVGRLGQSATHGVQSVGHAAESGVKTAWNFVKHW